MKYTMYRQQHRWQMSLLSGAMLFLGLSCGQTQPASRISDVGSYTGNIRMSLAHVVDPTTDDYEIVAASTAATAKMGVCLQNVTDCTPSNTTDYTPLTLFSTTSDRVFFRSTSARSAYLQDGLVLKVVAIDASGSVIDTRPVPFTRGVNGLGGAGTAAGIPGTGVGVPGTGVGFPGANNAFGGAAGGGAGQNPFGAGATGGAGGGSSGGGNAFGGGGGW